VKHRKRRTHLHKALSHTADHGKSGVPITSLAGLIQAQLGVPPAAQTLTGPHGEKQSIRAYLESNPTLYYIDERDDTVALSAAGLRWDISTFRSLLCPSPPLQPFSQRGPASGLSVLSSICDFWGLLSSTLRQAENARAARHCSREREG
jgi:hypothetical protein